MTKEETREYQKKWYVKNKDKHRALCKENYIKTRDKRLIKGREHYNKNKAHISQKHKEYRRLNKDSLNKKHREYNKIYREKHRDSLNKRKKIRYSKNKEIHFAGQIKRKYGISIVQYNELFKNQNGRCAICNKDQSNFKTKLGTDHCHRTGTVRGLLCFKCNTSLGQFNDDIDILENAINYLKKYKA